MDWISKPKKHARAQPPQNPYQHHVYHPHHPHIYIPTYSAQKAFLNPTHSASDKSSNIPHNRET
jgi:hypothetical protein